jgi:ribulose-5-phosphate 4-epimerase/fuculose-1-phosphate aldolase
VPGPEHHFLINPYGLRFDEVTASNLVKIDVDGRTIGAGEYKANEAGFVIHSAVHLARADAQCVFHTHTLAGMAVSAQAGGLLPIHMYSHNFYGRVAYHDFEGPSMNLGERERLVASLGSQPALILRNHGLLTVGRTIGEAFNWMHRLELSCHAQLAAMACNTPFVQVPQPVLEATWNNYQRGTRRPYGLMEWPALLRKLDRLDPSYKT